MTNLFILLLHSFHMLNRIKNILLSRRSWNRHPMSNLMLQRAPKIETRFVSNATSKERCISIRATVVFYWWVDKYLNSKRVWSFVAIRKLIFDRDPFI